MSVIILVYFSHTAYFSCSEEFRIYFSGDSLLSTCLITFMRWWLYFFYNKNAKAYSGMYITICLCTYIYVSVLSYNRAIRLQPYYIPFQLLCNRRRMKQRKARSLLKYSWNAWFEFWPRYWLSSLRIFVDFLRTSRRIPAQYLEITLTFNRCR
jgi:hypothetical protein